ncbi:hypothetical protein TeGR_g13812 [Tetraparma gracilis]|uniref:Uncharacterized protein n=1 Tax=Tetraparma gracilis TaxID=2962635 RepID=A0ABQ6M4G4_9STRA|nr:hypothetical protein TeGR_g13812 [Tetraparma gracilis]
MVDSISSLLSGDCYSASSIAPLEAHLSLQLSGSAPYSFPANRTLLKLYQFFPEQAKAAPTAAALRLALAASQADALALAHLYDLSALGASQVSELAALFAAGSYPQFWKAAGAQEELKGLKIQLESGEKRSFEGAMRRHVVVAMASV